MWISEMINDNPIYNRVTYIDNQSRLVKRMITMQIDETINDNPFYKFSKIYKS